MCVNNHVCLTTRPYGIIFSLYWKMVPSKLHQLCYVYVGDDTTATTTDVITLNYFKADNQSMYIANYSCIVFI